MGNNELNNLSTVRSFTAVTLLLLAALLPGTATACPCVETAVVHVDHEERLLIATVSESSRVMLTAALYELLLEQIQPDYPDWLADWRVSFFTTTEAALQGATSAPEAHVADYDRASRTLILWPRLAARRVQVELEIS